MSDFTHDRSTPHDHPGVQLAEALRQQVERLTGELELSQAAGRDLQRQADELRGLAASWQSKYECLTVIVQTEAAKLNEATRDTQ